MTIQEFKQYVIAQAKKLYESNLSEIDKEAMSAARKDIEDDGQKFQTLGKSKFEKNINKKELHKTMSPEKENNLEEKKYSDKASNFIFWSVKPIG